ncbi:MAG: fatty acid desaturase CarF family protein, partial [Myxococcota bacterium]|nr:fatty acid desaturase CarF family protein [Myxococcota bacterium]
MRTPAPSSCAPGPPRRAAAFDLAALLACVAAAAWLVAHLAAPPPLAWWPLLALAAAGGVALADLGSGLVHWFCDTWFRPETPGIGPVLIAPFREHHADPQAIVRRGALEVSSY